MITIVIIGGSHIATDSEPNSRLVTCQPRHFGHSYTKNSASRSRIIIRATRRAASAFGQRFFWRSNRSVHRFLATTGILQYAPDDFRIYPLEYSKQVYKRVRDLFQRGIIKPRCRLSLHTILPNTEQRGPLKTILHYSLHPLFRTTTHTTTTRLFDEQVPSELCPRVEPVR